jgi:multidrug efflux system membrane fusion protein
MTVRHVSLRWLPAACLTGLPVSGTLLLLLGIAGCSIEETPPATVPTVEVAQPAQQPTVRYLYATGTAEAVNRVDLVARMAGTLDSIDYEDGAEVKAGQRLFLIDPRQYQAQLQQAEASVEQAKATLGNADAQLGRQNDLSKSQVTSQSSVDEAQASRDVAKGQLAEAEAAVAQARLNLDYTSVKAPFDGVVTEHLADVGALVGSGSPTVLATITQVDPVQVSFTVPDRAMLLIRERIREQEMPKDMLGTVPVDLGTQIDNGYPLRGKLDYAAPESSSDTGTLAARAVFDNADRKLLPGLFVRLRIPLETVADTLLVESSAIGTDQEGRYVLVVGDEGKVQRRAVTLLNGDGGLQPVTGKLTTSDLVVTNVLSGVRPGSIIKPVRPTAPRSDNALPASLGASRG